MKPDFPLKPGDIVQLSPNVKNPMFGASMMIITELKSFGAQGFVQALGKDGQMGGQAYYRAHWDEMEFVGIAAWNLEHTDRDYSMSQIIQTLREQSKK